MQASPGLWRVSKRGGLPDSVQRMAEHDPSSGGENDPVQGALPLAGASELGGGREVPFPVALLAFSSVSGVGYRALHSLVGAYGNDLGRLLGVAPEVAVGHLRARKAPKALVEAVSGLPPGLVERAHEHLGQLGRKNVHVLGPGELPARLLRLPGGPRWLFVQGDPAALVQGPHVAVVGTRDASPAGIDAAAAVVRTMAAYPVTVVSGLANGIDAAAHARAVEFGLRNVAFLGHGINIVFPAETAQLRERMLEYGGAVATEYLPDERYRRQQFVQRNRLQAGLGELVIAVEGQASSGTAHTVRFAAQYGTPVVGLSWRGAGDLPRLVADTSGGRVLEIFTPAARRELDTMVRSLAERHGHATDALTLVQRQLTREAACRDLRQDDLLQLQEKIQQLLNERR